MGVRHCGIQSVTGNACLPESAVCHECTSRAWKKTYGERPENDKKPLTIEYLLSPIHRCVFQRGPGKTIAGLVKELDWWEEQPSAGADAECGPRVQSSAPKINKE